MAKIQMYSKDPCPYCVAAKKFFKARDIEFEEIDLTGKSDEIEKIKAKTGWSTVPIIIIDGKVIGGFTDLKALSDSGELEKMLVAQNQV